MTFPLADQSTEPLTRKLLGKLKRVIRGLDVLGQIRRERRDLLELEDHLLRDIGVDRDAAIREGSRSYWDVPAGRLPEEMATSVNGTPAPLPFVMMRSLS